MLKENLVSHTPGRWQTKTFRTIDERGSKIARNRVFDYHLSPDWRQMVIENPVSNDFRSTFVNCKERFRLPPTVIDQIYLVFIDCAKFDPQKRTRINPFKPNGISLSYQRVWMGGSGIHYSLKI